MKIAIATMRRCGSTLLYNIVREICNEVGILDSMRIGFLADRESDDWISWQNRIVKTDIPNKRTIPVVASSDVTLTARRDIRDVIASVKLCEHDEDYKKHVIRIANQYINWHSIWRRFSRYEFIYEVARLNPREEIKRIASALGFKSSIIDTERVTRNLGTLDSTKTETLISKNHIRNGKSGYYTKVLTGAEIAEIESFAAGWLLRFNYI